MANENNRYLVIADDFTGANDTGVQIRRRGLPVTVVLEGAALGADNCSYVLDTESRAVPSEAAYEGLQKQLAGVNFGHFRHVIKKVDSTLRGSIGAEIAATAAAMQPQLVVFAPALPDLGRTTQNAIHMLNGRRITQTEMAKDPKTPVTVDNIQAILQNAFDEPVRHITLEEMEAGSLPFGEARIFSADATANSHLQTLAAGALATGKRILWVGTAALADTLLGLERPVHPALGVIASLSKVSHEQLEWAKGQGAQLVTVPVDELLLGQTTPAQVAEKAAAALRAGQDVLLASAASVNRESGFAKADAAATQAGLPVGEVSAYTQKTMGNIARLVLDAYRPSGVFLTGGDTAIAFMAALSASGSQIDTELAVGIPMMRLRGGPFEGLKIVTKAGAFGKEDAISYALRKLKEREL